MAKLTFFSTESINLKRKPHIHGRKPVLISFTNDKMKNSVKYYVLLLLHHRFISASYQICVLLTFLYSPSFCWDYRTKFIDDFYYLVMDYKYSNMYSYFSSSLRKDRSTHL